MNKPKTDAETLLLVDDTPDNLVVMKKVLQRALPQVEIVTFQKPTEVMDYVRTVNVSAAIFDVQMPVLNGIELCQKIKSTEATRHIPVILVTSHEASSSFKAKGLDVGADDFLTRPLDNDELVAHVKVALRISRAEAQLRRTADQVRQDYQLLFEKMLSGFAVHEMIFDGRGKPVDYRFLAVNPAFETLLNLRAEDIVGKTVREVIPGLEPQWLERYGRVVETGESMHFEDYSASLDRHFDVTAFRTGENKFATSFTDITVRKQTEVAAQNEQALSNAVIDSIPGTFYLLDEHGRYARWNSFQRDVIAGKTDEQMTGLNAIETIHPEDRALIQSSIVNVLQNGKDEIVEGRVLLHGGPNSIWMMMTGRRMMVAGRPFLVGTGIDITERKQAEQMLHESEARFRDIVESMSDWIWQVDTNGIYTYIAGKFKTTLGYQEGEILGKTPLDFMPADEAKRVGAIFGEIVRGKKAFQDLENWSLTKEGRRVCMRTSGAPIFGNDGEFLGYRGVDTDITERKKAEEALRVKMEELQRWQTATLGREGRVAELKTEVNELAARLGEPPLYGALESSERKENS